MEGSSTIGGPYSFTGIRQSVTPDVLSAVVTHDFVAGYRRYRDKGVSASAHAFEPLLDHLCLECGPRRFVYYPGGGYSAAGQKPREDRGDQ
jgi:hypothetical protein